MTKTFFRYSFKKKFNWGWGELFSRGDFSWEGRGTILKIKIKKIMMLPRTYEKLHCKGEPYWFSS